MEQRATRLLAGAAGLGADTAVLMHARHGVSHSAAQMRQASAQAIS